MEVFQPREMAEVAIEADQRGTTRVDSKRSLSRLRVFRDERDRWAKLLNQMLEVGTQAQKMSALLDWVEARLAQPELGQELAEVGVPPELIAVPEPETATAETAVASTPAAVGAEVATVPQAVDRAILD